MTLRVSPSGWQTSQTTYAVMSQLGSLASCAPVHLLVFGRAWLALRQQNVVGAHGRGAPSTLEIRTSLRINIANINLQPFARVSFRPALEVNPCVTNTFYWTRIKPTKIQIDDGVSLFPFVSTIAERTDELLFLTFCHSR